MSVFTKNSEEQWYPLGSRTLFPQHYKDKFCIFGSVFFNLLLELGNYLNTLNFSEDGDWLVQQLFFSLFESSRPREDIAEHTGRRSYQIVVPYVHVDVLGGADMIALQKREMDLWTPSVRSEMAPQRWFRSLSSPLRTILVLHVSLVPRIWDSQLLVTLDLTMCLIAAGSTWNRLLLKMHVYVTVIEAYFSTV